MPNRYLNGLISATALLVCLSGAVFAGGNHAEGHHKKTASAMPMIDQSRAQQVVKSANWNEAERFTIEFDDNLYEPDSIELKVGKPYRITFTNVGEEAHDISGEDFFAKVFTYQVRTKDLRVKAYHLENVHINPGTSVELWLVPDGTGEFPFICTLPGHLEDGMEGGFTIVE